MAANLAFYVGRILKGTTPVDLAMKFDLVINLAAAKAIDLDIPPTLTRRELPPCSAGRRPPGLPGDRSASAKMVLLKLSWFRSKTNAGKGASRVGPNCPCG